MELKTKNSGRTSKTWLGAIEEFKRNPHRVTIREGSFIASAQMISIGRQDMKLPTFVLEEMALSTFLEPILSILETIMKEADTPPTLQTQNIMRAPIGSPAQKLALRSRRKY